MSDPAESHAGVAAVEEAFTALQRFWPAFEPRPPQRRMADAVFETFRNGGRIAVEAPTGVGKSIAYLIPAFLMARAQKCRVVISTHTKNLQQQIVSRDAPRIRDVIAPGMRVSLLKGRMNYLCQRRWERHVQMELLPGARPAFLERVAAWAARTETGDLEEFGARSSQEWAWLRELAAPADLDPSILCRQAPHCYVRESRKRAAMSPILVVNHALLLTHFLTPAQVLPEFDMLVVDEAHALLEVAAQALDKEVSAPRLRAVLARLTGGPELALMAAVRQLLTSRKGGSGAADVKRLDGIVDPIASVRRLGEATFRDLGRALGESARRYRRRDAESGLLGPTIDTLITSVGSLLDGVGPIAAHLGDASLIDDEEQAETVLTFQSAVAALAEYLETLHFVVEVPNDGYVHWYEPKPDPALVARPLHPGQPLRERLFRQAERVLLTSATLSTGDDFWHFLRRIGLQPGEAETLWVESPFEPRRQVLALAPPISGPDHPNFPKEVAKIIAALSRRIERKTMVLFTSFALLESVHALLQLELEADACVVLGQRVDGQRESVTRAFRRAERAVLLGTASFWGGVDFPGEELELLVITRLPFPVPGEPWVEARCEEIEAEGGSSFHQFMIPEAVLRFRQGFGRLIRRSSDRGVFVILDPRIRTASYRERFRDALPVEVYDTGSVGEAIARAAAWFDTRDQSAKEE